MKEYICKVCGYTCESESIPNECPVCMADSSEFSEVKK